MNRQSKKQTPPAIWLIISVSFFILLVVLIVVGGILLTNSIYLSDTAAKTSFFESYKETRETVYDSFKNTAYELAEQANHVSNRCSINIKSVKETNILEVLKVRDTAYIIKSKEDTHNNTTAWYKFTGTGVYTVDLSSAEYIVDNIKKHVCVRIPEPQLDSGNIDILSYDDLFFKENKWGKNNSIQSGAKLAQEMLNEAQITIQNDLSSNESYSKLAESTAKSMISALIESINSNITDLVVDVEYYPAD